MRKIEINEKGQALAPETLQINKEAFSKKTECDIYWLGGGGAMINACGTVIMLDPVLEGFDMPLLRKVPIVPKEVPKLDGVLITHIDNDHFSRTTCKALTEVCKEYHAPFYVAEEMQKEAIPAIGHAMGDTFSIGNMQIAVTPVKHNWQNDFPEYAYRNWKEEEYCGYLIETQGKKIWLPGDSRLMEEHLSMQEPDVILFDFSDDSWHITLEGAVKLANTYPDSELICIHYGCVDAPDLLPFNGNPEQLFDKVVHPERIRVLAPGEKYCLCVEQ